MRQFALVLLLAAAAPMLAGNVRLAWMHSASPAASLEVRLDDGSVVRSDANGAAEIGASRSIVVTDPETKLHLIEGAVTAGAVFRVPEPIRLRGRAAGSAGALRVSVGEGPRGDAVQRYHQTLGSLRPAHSSPPAGIDVAATPLRWNTVIPDGRQFTSDWIVADPPPQVVLSDSRGNMASLDVPVGDVRPHTTVNLGAIALHASAVLEIAPEGGSVAIAELHLRRAEIANAKTAARELAILEHHDRRLFELLVLGRPYYLHAGEGARLVMPRWLQGATVVLRDSYDERRIEKEVSFIAGRTTRIEWPKAFLPAVTVAGVVTSGGAPLPNATVVVPAGAQRRETKTDIGGRFRVDGVPAATRVPLYVDAGTGNARRTALFQVAPQASLSLQLPVAARDVADLPAMTAQAASPFANCSVADDQYPMVVAQSIPNGATYQYAFDWNAGTMTVTADRPGTYAFNVYATPFLFLQASVQVTSPSPASAPMTFIQPQNVALQVLNKNGFALAAGLELSFAAPSELSEWLDATQLDLSAQSTVSLPCVNINPLALYINDGAGNGCDGEIKLASTSCTIFLPADPTKPCSCH